MNKLNFAFFGGEPLAIPVLEKLKLRGLLPDLIVCNKDMPSGRNLILTPPPVKIWAEKNKISFVQDLKDVNKMFDLFIVVSYGKIIPQEILNLAKYGTVNLHPSLLPKHRGPSPIVTAILNGDTETGVTIIKIDEEMDHGPILAQEKIQLNGNETVENLEEKLAELGAELLIKVLNDQKFVGQEQDHQIATFTKKIMKEDAEINLSDDPHNNWRKYRAYHDSPRIFFFHPSRDGEKRIIVTDATLENGQFVIKKVLPEGRKEITWAEFEKINTSK